MSLPALLLSAVLFKLLRDAVVRNLVFGFHEQAINGARQAAKFGDDRAVFLAHGDIINAAAAHAIMLGRHRDQRIAELAGAQKRDLAMLRHRAVVVRIAGISKR